MPIKKELSLLFLTAMAVFSTSKLIFWDKTIADWDGYLILHLIVIAAVCSSIDLMFRFSKHNRIPDGNAPQQSRKRMIGLIVMLASAGVLVLTVYIFTHRGVQPIFL